MRQQYKMTVALVAILFTLTATAPFQVFGAKIQDNLAPAAQTPRSWMPLTMSNFPFNGSTVFGMSLNNYDTANGLTQAVTAGVNWARLGPGWPDVEPNEGARNWDPNLDQELKNASANHVQVIGLVNGTPAWAVKPGSTCAGGGPVNSTKFGALGNFLTDVVKRYSVAPYNVHVWELWNEEDAAGAMGCWGDRSDTKWFGGAYYGEMLKAVYGKIKAADPSSTVLVGGLLMDCDGQNSGSACVKGNPEGVSASHFFEGILADGAGAYFDGVSFHGYDYLEGTTNTYDNPNWVSAWNVSGPVSVLKGRYLKSLLTKYNVPNKSIYNTELAAFYGPNVQSPPCPIAPSAQLNIVKTDYVVQSYAAAVGEGWKSGIWFSGVGVRCSGLLNPDLSPQPSYYAYQYTFQKLNNTVSAGAISQFNQVLGYAYTSGGGKSIWVIWSKDMQNHSITLSKMPAAMHQIGTDGKPASVTPSTTITVTMAPLFIEY